MQSRKPKIYNSIDKILNYSKRKRIRCLSFPEAIFPHPTMVQAGFLLRPLPICLPPPFIARKKHSAASPSRPLSIVYYCRPRFLFDPPSLFLLLLDHSAPDGGKNSPSVRRRRGSQSRRRRGRNGLGNRRAERETLSLGYGIRQRVRPKESKADVYVRSKLKTGETIVQLSNSTQSHAVLV